LAEVFARKQLNEDGSPSDRYLINEEFVAMLDYYVAASLSAKVADADAMVTFIWSGLHSTRPSTGRVTGGIGGLCFLSS
jgi:hypothetical protein